MKLLLCIASLLLIGVADGTSRNDAISEEAADTSCTTVGLKMMDCTGYLNAGSKTNKPDQACCTALKTVLSINATCVCAAVHAAAIYGINLNMSRVPGLPKLCHVNNLPPAAQCNISVAPTPSPSVPTPSPSVPTPSPATPQPSVPVKPPTKPPTTAPPPSSPSPSMPTPAPPSQTPTAPPPTTPAAPVPTTPTSPAPTTPSSPAPATPTTQAPAQSPKSNSGISIAPLGLISAVVAPFLVPLF
ncbi:OLC1v1017469C1 [Oldenlandia corymbosa var. corymbosa]|uniref:OLC1v1017469C1 n=1 Tax=Oldenlandia corymbosa var. corymbosa TaxID=529605 RepID=A0AAV1E9I0_OLDCO|nr:OLC1v1017469C1 [Oldenlandia corymbosa var. corymbosa]